MSMNILVKLANFFLGRNLAEGGWGAPEGPAGCGVSGSLSEARLKNEHEKPVSLSVVLCCWHIRTW